MAFRTPRGYAVNRPQYQELSEGVRPQASTVPMEAYSGLAPVRIDELHHDPIVIDAGTIVGFATGNSSVAVGKLFPAHAVTGGSNIVLRHHSDGASWGLSTTDITNTSLFLTGGPVKPLGVVYQPIYSFNLQNAFTNYKRNDNVGMVTDYMIQIPCITAQERLIEAGDLVMVDTSANEQGQVAAGTAPMGRYRRYEDTVADAKWIVGRCFQRIEFADGTAAVNTVYDADTTASITTAGSAEFKGLDKVQTVPGLGLAGSGTGGVPAWLQKAQADGNGTYHALTLLIRL